MVNAMTGEVPDMGMSVGEQVAQWLETIGVTTVFGVISIHNMPILDALYQKGCIRFVPARGEAGAMNMADAYARVSGCLGVVITSTGTAAGNAAGSQVEALTACSPVLHITTQVDRPLMDRDRAAIHDVPHQPVMLRGVSKSVFRVWEARTLLPMLAAAAAAALSAPMGPVSIEIPIDVQRERAAVPLYMPRPYVAPVIPDPVALDHFATILRRARRPVLWLGGGARKAMAQAVLLADRGCAVVTSTNGRAIVPENRPATLGAFNMSPSAQEIYARSDLVMIVGSRLRGNETCNNTMPLGQARIQVDADATQGGRNYAVDLFVHGDAQLVLQGVVDRIPQDLDTERKFLEDVRHARCSAEADLRQALGPYAVVADTLRHHVSEEKLPFVRDVTIANSMFGNRYVTLAAPNLGVHALGGGIGQGIAMAIGAACAAHSRKTVALLGDGGGMLYIGELATAVEQQADIVFVLMNDRGYGVIRNIQDSQYGGRHCYTLSNTPDFAKLSEGMGMAYRRVDDAQDFPGTFAQTLRMEGPVLLEVDMLAIGPFARSFTGPPAGAAGSGVA